MVTTVGVISQVVMLPICVQILSTWTAAAKPFPSGRGAAHIHIVCVQAKTESSMRRFMRQPSLSSSYAAAAACVFSLESSIWRPKHVRERKWRIFYNYPFASILWSEVTRACGKKTSNPGISLSLNLSSWRKVITAEQSSCSVHHRHPSLIAWAQERIVSVYGGTEGVQAQG